MVSGNNNNYDGKERRFDERRVSKDRRDIVRFEDVLGRRTGVERRVSAHQYSSSQSQA